MGRLQKIYKTPARQTNQNPEIHPTIPMRPHTLNHLKLNDQIKIRLTDDEKAEILRRCREEGFRTMSDYARTRLFKKRQVKRIEVSDEFIQVFRTLDYDLVKIGTNLNQIAYKLNSYNTYMLSEEDKLVFKGVLKALTACYALLEHYLDMIGK